MNIPYKYDPESDAITIWVRKQKSDFTVELSEHILLDVTGDNQLVGLEILDASEEISKIFNRRVSREEIKTLLCDIKQEEPSREYLIQFRSPQKKESVNLFVPLYKSPIVA